MSLWVLLCMEKKNELSEDEIEERMRPFRVHLDKIVSEYNIPLDRIFNADQFGIAFQKLPNRIYCNPKERATIRGVKQMRDKNRLSGMACISAAGLKLPIPLVGKAARPQCWDLCDNKPPLPYQNQTNAWYDGLSLIHI